ncbi:MAG TPA: thiamine pyrophosphate-binding protein [Microvirga sp.]|jgi:thiamine pyrophosphate-dependent acetolactate synthase large subunit-like protein|nr:thiamine pyrophosphate-binding protein [Microvirga sp.]
MSGPKLYEKLAEAFHAEGTRTLFALLGDGNMHWAVALEALGCRSVYARHEHCAVSMAMAHANATGEPGIATVTCGPGLTQIMTALTTAVRAQIPLVVFAGEAPIGSAWYNQMADQAPYVAACGARYVQAHHPPRMLDQVREAFLTARLDRRPVVIGVPFDLQAQGAPNLPDYVPSTAVIPRVGRMMPAPEDVAACADEIRRAERVVLLAGRGAQRSDAAQECRQLADQIGAVLATTLPVRGLFHDHPYSLGVAGGFSSDVAREVFADADLVVAIGASVSQHTVDAGRLYPKARVVQIDSRPTGVHQGRRVADLYVRADAKAGLAAVIRELGAYRSPGRLRTPALADAIATRPADAYPFGIEPGLLDPRDVVRALDAALPKHWHVVNSSGHCSYFTTHMTGRPAERFHVIREFGAIGNGLSYAIGVAATCPDEPVVLFDGDGGLFMHAQELETVQRHGLPILMCILNDGAYGSEIHKLRSDGLSESGSVFGRGDLGRMARGFGLEGSVVTDLSSLPALVGAFAAKPVGTLLDFHISDRVMSPVMRRAHPARH